MKKLLKYIYFIFHFREGKRLRKDLSKKFENLPDDMKNGINLNKP